MGATINNKNQQQQNSRFRSDSNTFLNQALGILLLLHEVLILITNAENTWFKCDRFSGARNLTFVTSLIYFHALDMQTRPYLH